MAKQTQIEKDSDEIFNAISKKAKTFNEAKNMWFTYARDMKYTRDGCRSALARLEEHFKQAKK